MDGKIIKSGEKGYYLAFGLLIATAILMRIIFSTGYFATADDYFYSKAAHEISQGHFVLPNNHWNTRIGNTISIAAFYKLFGVGEYTATFSSILFSLLSIFVIILLCKELFQRDNYKQIALIASTLYIWLPISIDEGSSLSMGQGAAFFMYVAFYFMLVGERRGDLYWYIISGLTVGISYLFHETGAYILIIMFLYYLIQKKFEKKSLFILGAFVFVVGVEALSYYAVTGKWFYRQTLSLNPLVVLHSHRISEAHGFIDKLRTLKTISNPLQGTFLGDSWFLEPFRWSFLDPSNSILYYYILASAVVMLKRGDAKIKLLFLMFSGLYLFIAYGSPNPLSYEPLRRLPRYTLSCAIIGSIIAGYGLYKINIKRRNLVLLSALTLYLLVSLLSISIKGGEVGQKTFQAKNFYKYISMHPDKKYITDLSTSRAIEFLDGYQDRYKVIGLGDKEIIDYLNNMDINTGEEMLLVNLPEKNPELVKELNYDRLKLIKKYHKKYRKICYITPIKHKLSGSLCNVSKGGRIYQVLPKEADKVHSWPN